MKRMVTVRILMGVALYLVLTADTFGGAVVLVGADTVNIHTNRINNMYNRVLNGAALAGSAYDAVGVFNTNVMNPTPAQLQSYDTALVWGATSQIDAVSLGNMLADFVDGGGNVVMMMNFGLFAPQGRWMTGGYDPLISTGYTVYGQSIAPGFDSSNPLFEGVSILNAEYKMIGTARAGATVYAGFLPSGPAAATPLLVETTAFAGRVRNLNFLASDYFANTNGDIDRLIFNVINVGSASVNPVPEPSTLSIGLAGIGMALLRGRRRPRLHPVMMSNETSSRRAGTQPR